MSETLWTCPVCSEQLDEVHVEADGTAIGYCPECDCSFPAVPWSFEVTVDDWLFSTPNERAQGDDFLEEPPVLPAEEPPLFAAPEECSWCGGNHSIEECADYHAQEDEK